MRAFQNVYIHRLLVLGKSCCNGGERLPFSSINNNNNILYTVSLSYSDHFSWSHLYLEMMNSKLCVRCFAFTLENANTENVQPTDFVIRIFLTLQMYFLFILLTILKCLNFAEKVLFSSNQKLYAIRITHSWNCSQ